MGRCSCSSSAAMTPNTSKSVAAHEHGLGTVGRMRENPVMELCRVDAPSVARKATRGMEDPTRSPVTRSTRPPADRAPHRTTAGPPRRPCPPPVGEAHRRRPRRLRRTGLPELRLSSRSTRSFSASAPVTYDELVKPMPMTATGAAASNQTASVDVRRLHECRNRRQRDRRIHRAACRHRPNGTRAACTPTVSGAMAPISDSRTHVSVRRQHADPGCERPNHLVATSALCLPERIGSAQQASVP